MVTKKYVSGSCPAFEAGGKRVRFDMMTFGGSYFITSDEKLQEAIEKHPWFGRKIRVESVWEDNPAVESCEEAAEHGMLDAAKVEENLGDGAAENGTPEAMGEHGTQEVMSFYTLADAKGWLAEAFGVTPGSVKSKAVAVDIAEKNGVRIRFK